MMNTYIIEITAPVFNSRFIILQNLYQTDGGYYFKRKFIELDWDLKFDLWLTWELLQIQAKLKTQLETLFSLISIFMSLSCMFMKTNYM